jgi:hypothetical protein
VVVELVMEPVNQQVMLLVKMVDQEAELEQLLQGQVVLWVQEIHLQLVHLKEIMVVLEIEVHQHTLTEVVVEEQQN